VISGDWVFFTRIKKQMPFQSVDISTKFSGNCAKSLLFSRNCANNHDLSGENPSRGKEICEISRDIM
jgi:hypothetical protein